MNTGDSSKGSRIREFFAIEADVLRRRFRVIETLLPSGDRAGASHPGEEGRFVETLLRDFLNRHLPAELRALTGFIVRPATKTGSDDLLRVREESDQHSEQLDIIIYDVAHYPVYERIEEFCVVPPEGVVGLVSVKKTLRVDRIASEVAALARAAELCYSKESRGPYLGLFAFQAAGSAQAAALVFEKALSEMTGKPLHQILNEITVLDRFTIFRWRPDDSPLGHVRFVNVDCRGKEHIGLQRILQSILSTYYDPTRGTPRARPGFVSFEKGTFRDAAPLSDVPYSLIQQ
jgi:hypothetical protein